MNMGSSINLAETFVQLQKEDLDFQRTQIADLLDRRGTNFPGAQPVSFARRHLRELQRADYFMCEKTDGIRCLLFLSQFIEEGGAPVECQFFIDRKNDFYYVPRDAVHIPPPGDDLSAFHTGTLLDGELVRQRLKNGQKRLAYLIFDCLALDKENITHRPFDKRYGRAEQLVWKPYLSFAKRYPEDVASQPFQLQLKKMEMPYGAGMMFKDRIPQLPHGNDGLIFTCVTTPYVSGTDQHILKWKPPWENTIDLKLELGEFPRIKDEETGEMIEDWDAMPAIHLMAFHGEKDYRHFALLSLTDAEWETMKAMNQTFDGRIMECFRDPVSTHWRPKIEEDGTPRLRDDKTHANHYSVVESVIESIEDAVTEQDLIAASPAIRTAFKERQRAKVDADKKAATQAAHQQQQQQHARVPSHAPPAAKAEEDDGPRYED